MPLRTYTVGRAEAGRTLSDWLQERLGLSSTEARRLAQSRTVRVAGIPCHDPGRRLRPGQSIDVHLPEQGTKQGSLSPAEFLNSLPVAPILRHVDEQIVIVEKPTGLTTMRHSEDVTEQGPRARKYLPPTLADLLPLLLAHRLGGKGHRVRAVHRLDNETSGLVVFARTVEAEHHLGRQLCDHTMERRYLALVRGQGRAGKIESNLVRDRGDGRRGSTERSNTGQHAVTHVSVVEELGEYTLVECRLETGRTHQVRIHLGETGTPLCGERLYDRPLHGRPLSDGSDAPRILLHAATLGLQHPTTGERLHWSSPLPLDMQEVLERLRRANKQSSQPQ